MYFFSSDFRIKRGGPWVIPVRGQQLSWEAPDDSGAGQDENTHSRSGLRRLGASCELRPVLGRMPRYIPRLHHNLSLDKHGIVKYAFLLEDKLVSTANVLTFCLPANVYFVPICIIAGTVSMFLREDVLLIFGQESVSRITVPSQYTP